MKLDVLPALLLTILFLAFVLVWVPQYHKRLEPWMRDRIGRMLGFRIRNNVSFYNRGWTPAPDAPRGSGCVVLFWEFGVVLGCAAAPIFLALTLLVLILMATSP
jgi:hypothetical protein